MCSIMDNCNAVNDIQEIRQTLNKIEIALIGNEYSPKGIIHRLSVVEGENIALKSAILKTNESFNKIKYIAIGYGMGGAGIGVALLKIFGV